MFGSMAGGARGYPVLSEGYPVLSFDKKKAMVGKLKMFRITYFGN